MGALDWNEQDFYAEFGRNVERFIVSTREPRQRFIRKLSAKSLVEGQEETMIYQAVFAREFLVSGEIC